MIPQCWCISHSAWDSFNRDEYFLNILPFVHFLCLRLDDFSRASEINQEKLESWVKSQKKLACTWDEIVKCGVCVCESKCVYVYVCMYRKAAWIEMNREFFFLSNTHTLNVSYIVFHTKNVTSDFFPSSSSSSFVLFVCLCHYIEWENCLLNMLSYSIPFHSILFFRLMYFKWNENQHTMKNSPLKRWNNSTAFHI